MTVETLTTTFAKDVLIKGIVAGVVFLADFLFGDIDHVILLSLGTLTMFDFITALAATKHTGVEIESRRVIRTAYKFTIYLIMVSVAVLTERSIGFNLFIVEAIVSFIAITEGISVLENIGKMGFDVPNKLLNKLRNLKDDK